MKLHFLITLAAFLPLVPLASAIAAPEEQPVKIALIESATADGSRLAGPTISFGMRASEHEIIFQTIDKTDDLEKKFLDFNKTDDLKKQLFDFKAKTVRPLEEEGIVAGGNGEWRFVGGAAPYLAVRQGDSAERPYAFPAEDFEELNAMPADLYQDMALVAANDERVEMAVGAHYYRWNAATRGLEMNTNCDMEDGLENQAISRDGESIINADLSEISVLSTKTGEFTRHDKLPKTDAEGAYISDYGTYSLYAPPLSNAMTFHVISTANARELWNFKTNNMDDPVAFSPDEKYLVIGRGDRKSWEFHDIKTGEIARTLPMVAGANAGVFSPDGATLYSISGGVLYRQRAR